jgi:hypothetical protein
VGHKGIADVSAGTAFVVNDDLLTPDLGELFGDDPRIDVCRPARCIRYNDVNGSIGPSIYASCANQVRRKYRRST